jgi:hypothetical protein
MDISSGEQFAHDFRGHTITGEINRASAPQRVDWIARRARAMANAPDRDKIQELAKEGAEQLAEYLENSNAGELFELQVSELVMHLRTVRGMTVDGVGFDDSDRDHFVRNLPHGVRASALSARFDTDPLSDSDAGNSQPGQAPT